MTLVMPSATDSIARIETVAMLDDAQFDHAALRRSASRADFVGNVVSFYMADDALDYLAHPDHPTIDALLVDLHMPRMDGLEFLAEAKARHGTGFARSIYLALTLAPDEALYDDIMSLGFLTGWVEKPVTPYGLHKIAKDLASAEAA